MPSMQGALAGKHYAGSTMRGALREHSSCTHHALGMQPVQPTIADMSWLRRSSGNVSVTVDEARFTQSHIKLHRVLVEVSGPGQRYISHSAEPTPVDPVSHRYRCKWPDATLSLPLDTWPETDGAATVTITFWDRKKRRKTNLGTVVCRLPNFESEKQATMTVPVKVTMFRELHGKVVLKLAITGATEDERMAWSERQDLPALGELPELDIPDSASGTSAAVSMPPPDSAISSAFPSRAQSAAPSAPSAPSAAQSASASLHPTVSGRSERSSPAPSSAFHGDGLTVDDIQSISQLSLDSIPSGISMPSGFSAPSAVSIPSVAGSAISGSGVSGSGVSGVSVSSKRRRHRRVKPSAFQLDVGSAAQGIVFLEIVNVKNLPRFRTLTGVSFDMDPFVVISFGKKTFKTPYKRHTLNPTFNTKLLLVVDKDEQHFEILFTVWDKDKITLNDRVAQASIPLDRVVKNGPQLDVDTGLYDLDSYEPRTLAIPLELFNGPADRGRTKRISNPEMQINIHYLPFGAVRQQLWRGVVSMYDTDESSMLSYQAVCSMLSSLGSTLKPETIRSFFTRCGKNPDTEKISTDELVKCIEAQLTEDIVGETTGEATTERVILLRVCPMCQEPQQGQRHPLQALRHMSVCASRHWSGTDTVLLDDRYITSKQATRRWYSKFLSKFSFGSYKLGANSANILVQDRLTGQIDEEKMGVHVRMGIRLLYATAPVEARRVQKLLRKYTLKQGIKFESAASCTSIKPFIRFHQLDMSDVEAPVESFQNFNEFFYRKLKPGARPCENVDEPRTAVSLADCRLILFPTVSQAQEVWIKGSKFSVGRLLSNTYPADVDRYKDGSLVIFRLAPQDYHRFHIPVDGVLGEPKHVPGHYYTVNPMAIRSTLDVYGENARTVVPIDSPQFGRVMIVLVGAMMVGGIEITAKPGSKVHRTEELGYFKFGGSTAVVLFEKDKIVFDSDLVSNSSRAIETLVRVGMSIGHTPDSAQYVRSYDTRKHAIKRAHTDIVGGGSYMPFTLD